MRLGLGLGLQYNRAVGNTGPKPLYFNLNDVYQDVAKTTVANIGDPVRAIVDTTGNSTIVYYTLYGATPPLLTLDGGGKRFLNKIDEDSMFKCTEFGFDTNGYAVYFAMEKSKAITAHTQSFPKIGRTLGTYTDSQSIFFRKATSVLELKNTRTGTGATSNRPIVSNIDTIVPLNTKAIFGSEAYLDSTALFVDGDVIDTVSNTGDALQGAADEWSLMEGLVCKFYGIAVASEPAMSPYSRNISHSFLNNLL